MSKILVLFYTRHGSTAHMAEAVADGVIKAGGEATLRRLADDVPVHIVSRNPRWMDTYKDLQTKYPPAGTDVIKREMAEADGIVFGSPTRFGNMAAPMKELWDRTSDMWTSGALVGKPGAVFTGAANVHGGQEATALSMILPMLHHGMIIVGLPNTTEGISNSGSPYGPTFTRTVSGADMAVAAELGKRIARVADALAGREL